MDDLLDRIFDDIADDDQFHVLLAEITALTPDMVCQIVTYDGRVIPAQQPLSFTDQLRDELIAKARKFKTLVGIDKEKNSRVHAYDIPEFSAVLFFDLPDQIGDLHQNPMLATLIGNSLNLARKSLEIKQIQLEKKQLDNQIHVLVKQHSKLIDDNHRQYLLLREKEKQYANELESEIAKQTKELREANKELREASRLKNEFLANMSHELRTPMNAIIGFAGLLEGTELTGEQKEYVKILGESGEGLLVLINDILDLAKIEAGKLDLIQKSFPLAHLLNNVIALFRTQAGDKNNRLHLQLEPDLPDRFVGDENRLRQVLINLIGNAMKFTNNGEIKVIVKNLQSSDDKISRINFAVQDAGIGIPLDQQAKVFEKFSQIDGSSTRQFGGTGLGLAICHQLVVLMEGEIVVKSEPGKGSTFSFEIPLMIDKETKNAANLPKNIQTSPTKTDDISQAITVLIVEDNLVNQRLATILVNKQGCDTLLAGDGVAALTTLQEKKVDLILMDIQMPNMDGITATKKIRALESSVAKQDYAALSNRKDPLPIIALSAHAREEDKQHCYEAGMDDFLTKPIIKAELAAIIQKFRRVNLTTKNHSIPSGSDIVLG